MSTAPAPTLPVAAKLDAVRTHARVCFGFACGFSAFGLVMVVAWAGLASGARSASGYSNTGAICGGLMFLMVSVALTFLGLGMYQVHEALRNQDERLARLERLLEEREGGR